MTAAAPCPECGEVVSAKEDEAAYFFAVLEFDIQFGTQQPLDEIDQIVCQNLDIRHRLTCRARPA